MRWQVEVQVRTRDPADAARFGFERHRGAQRRAQVELPAGAVGEPQVQVRTDLDRRRQVGHALAGAVVVAARRRTGGGTQVELDPLAIRTAARARRRGRPAGSRRGRRCRGPAAASCATGRRRGSAACAGRRRRRRVPTAGVRPRRRRLPTSTASSATSRRAAGRSRCGGGGRRRCGALIRPRPRCRARPRAPGSGCAGAGASPQAARQVAQRDQVVDRLQHPQRGLDRAAAVQVAGQQ